MIAPVPRWLPVTNAVLPESPKSMRGYVRGT